MDRGGDIRVSVFCCKGVSPLVKSEGIPAHYCNQRNETFTTWDKKS